MYKSNSRNPRTILGLLFAIGVLFSFGILPVPALSYNNGSEVWVDLNKINKELGKASNEGNGAAISIALKQVGVGSDGTYDWYYIRVAVIGLGVNVPYNGPTGNGWNDADGLMYLSGAIYSMKVIIQSELSGTRSLTRGDLQPDSSSQDNNEGLRVAHTGASEKLWTQASPVITMASLAMSVIAAAAGSTFLPVSVLLTAYSLMAATSSDLSWGYEPWWWWWADNTAWIEYPFGIAVPSTYGHYPLEAPEEAEMTTYFWWRVPKSGSHQITVSASLTQGIYYFSPSYYNYGFKSTNVYTGVSLRVKAA